MIHFARNKSHGQLLTNDAIEDYALRESLNLIQV